MQYLQKNYFKQFLLLIFVSILLSCNQAKEKEDYYVVILSMDGFRWDYAERANTPNLDLIAEKGVKAEYVIPAFPTKTFPNHYTMATGLYPDNHGIVDNNFYCPELKLRYRLGDRESVENSDFYFGEPIWVTAENQGVRAASYFWVGSELPVKDIQPSYWKRYDHEVPFTNRIDTVFHWLNLPEEERPRLVLLYFHEPDRQGHVTGPESPEIDILVESLDSLVGVIKSGIEELYFADKVNFIVTSDHGMTETTTERYINLFDYLERDWIQWFQGGNPVFSLETVEGMTDSVYNILKNVENISVWKKEEIPARLNYGKSDRIRDILVLADATWSMGFGEPRSNFYAGAHGWDNADKDMHTIFYAVGPSFKINYSQPPFELVDLYPLLAKILNLNPAEVDGKLERVEPMLKK